MEEKILILDFGSQYTQLIARRIRELNVYCEIHPYHHLPELTASVKGIILSGSPSSVRDENAPRPSWDLFAQKIPVLGICYGAQLMASLLGGEVEASKNREYGRARLNVNRAEGLFRNVDTHSQVWMSHGDTITRKPQGIRVTASTDSVEVAAFQLIEREVYGIQFHPEVTHSLEGRQILENFVVHICGCRQTWTPGHFIENAVEEIRMITGNDCVVLGLSGGVDSSVAAALIHKAIGSRLYCIFVNNGLLRKNEFAQVLDVYRQMGLNIKGVDASDRFLDALAGVSEPEQKRKIIGKTFIDVFDEAAQNLPNVRWLAQGTIYPDVIESVSVNGPSATIKSHHNVGGLPENMNLQLLEPLRTLFKDEVRRVGREAGVPDEILKRHPFPGPGLAIRIIGEINRDHVRMLQEADALFIEGLKSEGLYDSVWQAGAIFLPVRSVGVMGDERTYEHVICLRAVTSVDGMTADWAELPHSFLGAISNSIINQIKGINRVVFDISSKPPATIEWE